MRFFLPSLLLVRNARRVILKMNKTGNPASDPRGVFLFGIRCEPRPVRLRGFQIGSDGLSSGLGLRSSPCPPPPQRPTTTPASTTRSVESSAPGSDAGKPMVRIFDTTLRDGEQSPGASLNLKEKLEIARVLEQLGVDIIEAGFPITSQGDFEAVSAISAEIGGCTIAGLARCTEKDVRRAGEAVKHAKKGRIHVFLATSKIHREFKLKKAKEEIIRMTRENVGLARSYVEDVEFSPEDASRTELDYLAEVVHAAIEAGATTINCPDTVGFTTPGEYRAMFEYLIAHVPGAKGVIFSTHCHNDLGLAVANSLAAIRGGRRPPGGVHDQRHRGAGGECVVGGGRDDDQDAE